MDQRRSVSRADHVIGIFSRERLSAALSAVHRSGFGQHVRVFDGTRQPVGDQIARAGLRLVEPSLFEPDALMIVVSAPGRTAQVAEMFHETNAERVIFAERALLAPSGDVGTVILPQTVSDASGTSDS
jgi:hypothetical protein